MMGLSTEVQLRGYRAGHQSRQLSQAILAFVADYHARAELAAQSAPPSSPVEIISEEEAGEA